MIKRMNIEGMTCTHCSGRVEQTLNEIEGVSANVNLEEKSAVIEADDGVNNEVLKKAVEDAGYRVISIE